jgi:hypothetical protein
MHKLLIIVSIFCIISFNQEIIAQNIQNNNQTNNQTNTQTSRNSANSAQELLENNKNKSSYALYKDEINKRFKGGEWEKNLTQLDDRALMQEYARIMGISNHLSAMNMQKKERIEALLATYTAMQLQIKQKEQQQK